MASILPHAVTPAELRERAYEAFAAGDWPRGRRLNAEAKRMEARAAYERAETNHGRHSHAGLEALRRYRIATNEALRMEMGR